MFALRPSGVCGAEASAPRLSRAVAMVGRRQERDMTDAGQIRRPGPYGPCAGIYGGFVAPRRRCGAYRRSWRPAGTPAPRVITLQAEAALDARMSGGSADGETGAATSRAASLRSPEVLRRLRRDRARPESERRYQLEQRTVQGALRRSSAAAANPLQAARRSRHHNPTHPRPGTNGRDPRSLSPPQPESVTRRSR